MDSRVTLGRVVDHHGLKGWLKVHSFTEPRDGLFDYKKINIGDSSSLEFEFQVKGKILMLRPAGSDCRETSEPWLGQDIWLERDAMPATEPGEYYWHDLQGCTVSNLNGVKLGKVARMIATGANDVIVVQGTEEILIPFVQPQVVVAVDITAGEITVDWDPSDI
ncbi:MAG: ribosome maturation factor RimM [Lysobacterales bacterium]